MNSDVILKAENLHFSYDDEQSHSLNGLSLESGVVRRWPLWELTEVENPLFSSAVQVF